MTFSADPFTIVHAKGDGSNFAAYSPWRVYTKNTITITAGSGVSTITKIEIVHSTTYYGKISSSVGDVTMATSSGGTSTITITAANTTSVTLTNTGSAQLRCSEIIITYETGSTGTTLYLGLFLAAFVAVRACVRRVECLYATFHHIIMSKIDFRSVHFAKALFFLFSVHFFCLTKRNERKKSQDCGGCVAKNLSFRGRLNRTRCARTAI